MPPTKGIVRSRYEPPLEAHGRARTPLNGALTAMGMTSWQIDLGTLRLTHAGAPLEIVLGRLPEDAVSASST
ncbi:MAG: hypothetical protein H0U66_17235 [Gemmatimonadaceae bacterium]|nr:hypothetical protein [Gemmatimonadaceae bacterium]